jgi:hypothetical protein
LRANRLREDVDQAFGRNVEMNKHMLAAAAAVALLLGGTSAVVAQNSYDGQNRWMTVNNYSYNGTAVNIYIIPAGANCCWSHDLLGSAVITPNRSLNVNFDNGSRACVFDIRITSEDPRRDWNFYRIDVCRESALNLR